MNWWDVAKSSALSAATVICFLMLVGLVLADRLGGAAIMGTAFTLTVVLHYLPQMESLKAYGIEAKMRAKLTEAEELLEKMRQASLVSAKLMYHTFSWQSRMAHPVKIKQNVADEVEAQLLALGIAKSEIEPLRADYIRFGLFDLLGSLAQLMQTVKGDRENALLAAMNKNGDADSAEFKSFSRQRSLVSEWMPRGPDISENLGDFRQACLKRMPSRDLLPEEDFLKLEAFVHNVAAIGADCQKTGRITEEASDLIEQDYYKQSLFKKVFGRDSTGIR